MNNKVIEMKIKYIIPILLIAIILISSVAFAQPFSNGKMAQNGMNSQMGQVFGMGMPFAEPIFTGHGFALFGDEYHILHVNVMKTAVVRPDFILSMLYENRTPREIAQSITGIQKETQISAHMRFAGEFYDLNITGYDNSSLTGEILPLQTDPAPEVLGNISLSMSDYEGEILSTGTLIMNGKDYKVLMTSVFNPGRGMGRRAGFQN